MNWRVILPMATLVIIGVLLYGLLIQSNNLDKAKDKIDGLEITLAIANADKAELEAKNRKIADTDDRLTKELVNAKSEIAKLNRDVATGVKRLRLSAKCPATPKSSTTGMDDATTARLTDSAERDYFTLRERVELSRLMIIGLQEYVATVCLK